MGEISTESTVVVGGTPQAPTAGSAGLETQVNGAPVTVSSVAGATGGEGPGQIMEVSIDEELFKFESDDTPLMQLMLWTKAKKVDSAVIQHFQFDEPRSSVYTTKAVGGSDETQVVLNLAASDKKLLQPYTTVLVKGVDGYTEDGRVKTPGKDLMLFITSLDNLDNPVAVAVNGERDQPTDEQCKVPEIPAGTQLIILSNAMFETQERVAPSLIVPTSVMLYAQKRGLNHVVSDYFASHAKRIPYAKAQIAEAQIRDFKHRGNRTLWAGRKSKFTVQTELGPQTVYTCEGLRWQIKRQLDHKGKWTYEELQTLLKMVFTGEDKPKAVVLLGGKNFIENMQCIDYSKHPEVKIVVKTNPVGWEVTTIRSVFGDMEIKHEPTLDRLGYSNSAAILAYDRLSHYIYSQEHKKSEKVEGHEAQRQVTIVWDALGLKGTAHMWIDGEGESGSEGTTTYTLYEGDEAPEKPSTNTVYVLVSDCAGISANAVKGTMWTYDGNGWSEYTGEIIAA